MNPSTIRQLPHPTVVAAALGMASAALLALAFAFQHLGGLEPCVLCVAQRWPHLLAAGAGLWVWLRRGHNDVALAMLVGTIAMLASLGLGALHTGVEMGLWASPVGCGMPDWTDPNLAATMSQQTPADCSQPAWTFLGHSMAAWNALLSSVLVGLWGGSMMRLLRAPSPASHHPAT